jgi:TetR/AcrR family transcriptional regulator, lmrAB and yxaGH operons repressor
VGVTTDTRKRMVTSAALLLREHGVAGTSIAKVLEHSQGPRGSVGFHFPGGRAELLTDALRWAGGFVTTTLRKAAEHEVNPVDVFAGICEHDKQQLTTTDYAAGCPIGAAAQEAYRDPALGPVVSSIVDDWQTGLAEVLTRSGHDPREAADLSMLCISALEGAITMSRVQRSTKPIDIVLGRLSPLLHRP